MPHLGNHGLERRTDVGYPRESAEPDAERGSAEHLQKPWCGSEVAPANGAKDV